MAIKVIYVAGPMTGYPHCNVPEFNKVAEWLRRQGHIVFSPAELEQTTYELKDKPDLRRVFAVEFEFICKKADTVVMLPKWEHSKGAFAEWALAKALGHEIWYLTGEEYA